MRKVFKILFEVHLCIADKHWSTVLLLWSTMRSEHCNVIIYLFIYRPYQPRFSLVLILYIFYSFWPCVTRSVCLPPVFLFSTECPCHVDIFKYQLIVTDFTNEPSSSFWITKGGRMWPYQLIFSRSTRFLFTTQLGCSQDSRGTRAATDRCAGCKHYPGLTCVYPITL